jgi:hypothetical protein
LQFSKNSDPRVGYKSHCSPVEFIETNEHLEKELEKFENELEWNEILSLKNLSLCIFIMLLQVILILIFKLLLLFDNML